MTIKDFENALHHEKLRKWFDNNVDNLIKGTTKFRREDKITEQIANLLPNVNAQINYRDFTDKNGDIGEAAHNGTYQAATHGVEHMIKRFFQRYDQNERENYFGLMYLLDVRNIDEKTTFSKTYINNYRVLQNNEIFTRKEEIEKTFEKMPGGIKCHKDIYNVQGNIETTIVNYDIYVLQMKLNNITVQEIYKSFKDEDFFKRVGFNQEWLNT